MCCPYFVRMLESREHNVHEAWSWDAAVSPKPQRFFSHYSSPVAEGIHIRMQPLGADWGILQHPLVNNLDVVFRDLPVMLPVQVENIWDNGYVTHCVGVAISGAQNWYFKHLFCRIRGSIFVEYPFPFSTCSNLLITTLCLSYRRPAVLGHFWIMCPWDSKDWHPSSHLVGACRIHPENLSLQGGAAVRIFMHLMYWVDGILGTAAAIHSLIPIPLENDLNPYPSKVL